jgi:methylmalonyl-CoA mutase cobalamin-binding subunit
MRRIIQSTGVEVIHLGHDRSVEEVVNTAIQDANAIAITSYQGGHNEYFKYMYDLQEKEQAKSNFLAVEVAYFAFRNSRITSVLNHQNMLR